LQEIGSILRVFEGGNITYWHEVGQQEPRRIQVWILEVNPRAKGTELVEGIRLLKRSGSNINSASE
jgi:hypothetical protein